MRSIGLFLGALLVPALALPAVSQGARVSAQAETDPVPSSGDAADDPALWVHPTMPGRSLVIGTDKDSGLGVYDLDGAELQFLPDGQLNNVDVRYGFPLGGDQVALVTAGNRTDDSIAIYAVDRAARRLHDVAARDILLGITIYGSGMYRSATTGETYFIGTAKNGKVEQWRLFDDGAGRVDAELVREFDVGGQTEGCVADDETGYLFLGEENSAIWRYGAEPTAGNSRVAVDRLGGSSPLRADIEGLALYHAADGAGYLIASSQGNSTFVVYERTPPHYRRLVFGIDGDPLLDIDRVTGTDGIEVINLGLGARFPHGVFLAQDDSNTGGNQNFKLVGWDRIAAAASPPLVIDTTHDAHGAQGVATVPILSTGALVALLLLLLGTAARSLRRR